MRALPIRAVAGAAVAIACAFLACVGEDSVADKDDPSANHDASTADGGGGTGTDGGGVLMGEDASHEDAARPACNVAVPDTPAGTVACVGDGGCNGDTPKCCYGKLGTTDHCYTGGTPCDVLTFVCDKASDCAADHVCCLAGATKDDACPHSSGATGSECRPRDGGCGADLELCSVASACSSGHCEALTATVSGSFARRLGACF